MNSKELGLLNKIKQMLKTGHLLNLSSFSKEKIPIILRLYKKGHLTLYAGFGEIVIKEKQ